MRPKRLGDGDPVLDRLLGEQWPAGGDAADERQHGRVRMCGRRLRAYAADELESARLRRIALQQAGALEIREMRVHRRRRREPDRVPISRTVGG